MGFCRGVVTIGDLADDSVAAYFGPALPEPETNSASAASGPEEPDSSPAPPSPREDDGAIRVELTLEIADIDPPIAGWLDAMAIDAARAASVRRGELSIAVVGDEQMAQLHEQYKDVPGTTDVLTFDLGEDLDDNQIEGEIIVCLDEAARQAAQRGHSVRHELLLYVVHGILHLLGEDDHEPDDFKRMHDREDQILTLLGLGAVFARGEDA